MSIAMTAGLIGALAGAVVALVALPRRAVAPAPDAELAEATPANRPADSQ
jgi:hypothetical protein